MNIKAFSLLEIIITILLLGLVLSFAIPKLIDTINNSNIIKLKSQYSLIQENLNQYKTKKILLSEDINLNSLDDAKANTKKEKLFNEILDFKILSTDSLTKESGLWIKHSDKSYSFIISSKKAVKFLLEDNYFKCIENIEICNELN